MQKKNLDLCQAKIECGRIIEMQLEGLLKEKEKD